jgi:predicted RNase H-like nuclease (RuvC/YqgF family)
MMSLVYICRCGEKKKPCIPCLNQTCNELRYKRDSLQGELIRERLEHKEEIDQLKAEVKKKKNRIGILNRSLRRLKKG